MFKLKLESKVDVLKCGIGVQVQIFRKIIRELRKGPRRH